MVELTRRERQRRATYDEIMATARGLLRSGGEVSIRAVAGEMGMTPPALYRYVTSVAELESLVVGSIFDDVIAAMSTARDRYPNEDPPAQIVAAATAFRGWGLANPREFTLVFGTPPAPESTPKRKQSPIGHLINGTEPECGPGERFGMFFSEIFTRLWMSQPFEVPPPDEIDPSFAQLHKSTLRQPLIGDVLGDKALGVLWTFEMAWVRLYGIVTLEVFQHIPIPLIESGAMFRAQMLEIGRTIGLADQWERLRLIADETDSRLADASDA